MLFCNLTKNVITWNDKCEIKNSANQIEFRERDTNQNLNLFVEKCI